MTKWLIGGALICWLLWQPTVVLADDLQSSHYRFTEQSVGGSSLSSGLSPNYQVLGVSGVLGVGNSASTNIQINAGDVTTGDPALTFAVNNGTASFSSFSAAVTATTTVTFSVIDYTSYGYIVQIFGPTPTRGTHVIPSIPVADFSQTGTEQFGINTVANTVPSSFGANPDNGLTVNGFSFGHGQAHSGYNTSNKYQYNDGDIIAQAPKSSGQTTYTISYIVNVSSLTPAGQYSAGEILLCTPTF